MDPRRTHFCRGNRAWDGEAGTQGNSVVWSVHRHMAIVLRVVAPFRRDPIRVAGNRRGEPNYRRKSSRITVVRNPRRDVCCRLLSADREVFNVGLGVRRSRDRGFMVFQCGQPSLECDRRDRVGGALQVFLNHFLGGTFDAEATWGSIPGAGFSLFRDAVGCLGGILGIKSQHARHHEFRSDFPSGCHASGPVDLHDI